MTDQIRKSMALLLAYAEVDLGDERAVMRLLKSARHRESDIFAYSGAAIKEARAVRAANHQFLVS
jgi:hypothetical protein